MNALWLPNWTVLTMKGAGKTMNVEAEYDILPESCPLVGARIEGAPDLGSIRKSSRLPRLSIRARIVFMSPRISKIAS